jgi:hypothetical protein
MGGLLSLLTDALAAKAAAGRGVLGSQRLHVSGSISSMTWEQLGDAGRSKVPAGLHSFLQPLAATKTPAAAAAAAAAVPAVPRASDSSNASTSTGAALGDLLSLLAGTLAAQKAADSTQKQNNYEAQQQQQQQHLLVQAGPAVQAEEPAGLAEGQAGHAEAPAGKQQKAAALEETLLGLMCTSHKVHTVRMIQPKKHWQ